MNEPIGGHPVNADQQVPVSMTEEDHVHRQRHEIIRLRLENDRLRLENAALRRSRAAFQDDAEKEAKK